MLLFHLCKDQNVIQVHYHDPFGYESPEDVIHYGLEDGGNGDQREFDLETRVTTNGNRIISEMLHSCALNK